MLKKLLSSKNRVEVLKLLLFNPDESYYQRQISRLTGQPIRAIQREIKNLKDIGLIEKRAEGNRVYYKINKGCPIYEDLKRIFFKVEGIGKILKEYLKKNKDIEVAFIYGSYAKGSERISSDIDLMVIGDISSKKLSKILSGVKEELGREINYMVLTEEELREKVDEKEHFITEVLNDEKIFLIGDEGELKRITG